MPEYIYVLGMDGRPQMPTTRRRHVQKLLNTGKARIAGHVPFTIQLLYKNDPVLQPVVLALDPGRTNIGLAALSLKGDLLFSAVAETRNREIAKLIQERRMHRRASRNGERRARQRLAKRFGTVLKAGHHSGGPEEAPFGEEPCERCRCHLTVWKRCVFRKGGHARRCITGRCGDINVRSMRQIQERDGKHQTQKPSVMPRIHQK